MSVPLRLDERWVECLSQVKVDSPMFRGFLALRVDGGVDGMGGGKETRIREGTQGNPPALMSPFPHCLGRSVNRCGEWGRGERASSVSTVELLYCFHPCGNKSMQGLSF